MRCSKRFVIRRISRSSLSRNDEMGTRDYLQIDHIVFIGRTFDEYMKMFGLNEEVLNRHERNHEGGTS